MTTKIYAVHTDDGGAPINESALCENHLYGAGREYALAAAEAADDRPVVIEFNPVAHPELNDTVCIECGEEGS